MPAWLLPVAVGVLIALAGAAVFWFAYLGPLRDEVDVARAAYSKGDYARAEKAAETILARDANQVDALLVLARVKAATGSTAEALALYGRVIDRWPNDAGVLYETSSLERLVGSTAAAVPHLERALALEPDNAQYLGELVKAYTATGKARTAAELLLERAGEASRSKAERADLYVSAARAFMDAGSNGDARRAVQQALRLVPANAEADRILKLLK